MAGDDWYQRRREDKEGAFFRDIAGVLGKKGHAPQGIYVFTADGTTVTYKNTGQSADATKSTMRVGRRPRPAARHPRQGYSGLKRTGFW